MKFSLPRQNFYALHLYSLITQDHRLPKAIRQCKYKQEQNTCYDEHLKQKRNAKGERKKKGSERFNELKLFNLSKRRSEDLKVPTQETKFQ